MFSSPLSIMVSGAPTLTNAAIIEDCVIKRGVPIVMPSSFYRKCDTNALRLLCHQRGIYQLITEELVNFLTLLVGQRKAIEVACGYGTLGRAMNIPFSDLRIQEDDGVKAYYKAAGQPVIAYPNDVKKMDANHAVKKLKPDVVLACWITEKISAHGQPKNMFGPDEQNIVDRVGNYVVMGNLQTHGDKAIRKQPHHIVRAKWINSRSAHKDDDVIMIWGDIPRELREAKHDMNFTIEYHYGIKA